MRKIGLGFLMLIMITSSVVFAEDSQTVTLSGKGDALVLNHDCSLPSGTLDPYLGIKDVQGSVSTVPCPENQAADCPNGYKIMANIQIDKGCGPRFSTNGPVTVEDPDYEFVDCNAPLDGNSEAIIARFIVRVQPDNQPSRMIEVRRRDLGTPNDPSDDAGSVITYIPNYTGFGTYEWWCHRIYGVDYEGRRVICR